MQTEMSGPRLSVLLGLVLLLVSVGPCRGSTVSEEISESQALLSVILNTVQEIKNSTLEDSKSFDFFNNPFVTLDGSEVTDNRDHPEWQRPGSHYESEPTPLHMTTSFAQSEATREYMKMMFILDITGPLHFNAKCSSFYRRLYNRSEECTTPELYLKCASLLMRLAANPVCQKPKENIGKEATPSQIP